MTLGRRQQQQQHGDLRSQGIKCNVKPFSSLPRKPLPSMIQLSWPPPTVPRWNVGDAVLSQVYYF